MTVTKFICFVDELTDIMNPYPGKHMCWSWTTARYTMYQQLKRFVPKSMSSYLNNTNHNIIGVSRYCIYPHTPLTTTQSKSSFLHTRHSCATMPSSFSW